MREIKFRVWNKENKKMINLNKTPFAITYNGNLLICENQISGDFVYVDNKDYEVMFYSGLKDKNGKEIYEGDIVKINIDGMEEIGLIVFSNSCFMVKVFKLGYNSGFFSRNTEVIGNRYEHPELLKGDKNEQ